MSRIPALALTVAFVSACGPTAAKQGIARPTTQAAVEEVEPGLWFTLPAESDPVERLVIAWHDEAWDFEDYFADILRVTPGRVTVTLVVPSEVDGYAVMGALAQHGVATDHFELVTAPLDSMWIRDFGPLVVRDPEGFRWVVDARYAPDRQRDDRVPQHLAAAWNWPVRHLDVELEGGHIQSDGRGTCLVSDDLATLNLEQGIGWGTVERALRDYLGCRRIQVLLALDGEPTGHLDMSVYLVRPNVVLVGDYDRADDEENSLRLDANASVLRKSGFEVIRVPMPRRTRSGIFRSYTNALVLGDVVLVPVYDTERRRERQALRAFLRAFPDHEIVPVPSDDVIELSGAVHCTTMTVSLGEPQI